MKRLKECGNHHNNCSKVVERNHRRTSSITSASVNCGRFTAVAVAELLKEIVNGFGNLGGGGLISL
jgi:hypothetical protein